MTEEVVSTLKIEYAKYLDTLGVTTSLRSLGRFIGVKNPTELKKEELIEKIIAVLVGELEAVSPSKRGAPVKDDKLNPDILITLETICLNNGGDWLFAGKTVERKEDPFAGFFRPEKNVIGVHSSEFEKMGVTTDCVGQLEKTKNFYCLFPLDGRSFVENVFVDERLVKEYSLKEGDVLVGKKREKGNAFFVTEISLVNGIEFGNFTRRDFECGEVCSPSQKISLRTCKYVDWFLPVVKGGRCLIVSPPKAGKTSLLKEIAKDCIQNTQIKTLGLLIEQPIEIVSEFRKIYQAEDLLYTTYEEEADVHVFIAEFLLKRAKSYVEAGKDVCVVIEGLQSLAKAYDEVNFENGKTLSCGLSAKTVRYLKKVLTTARAFDGGGSLTVICTTSVGTGNPEDDIFFSEISPLFNTRIHLSEELALKRVYPAIDLENSFLASPEKVFEEKMNATDLFIREKYLPVKGNENLCCLIAQSDTLQALIDGAKSQLDE